MTVLEPYAAHDLPDLPRDVVRSEAMTSLVVAVNGFVYAGDRLTAILDAVKVLRANPDLAHALLVTSTSDGNDNR